MWHSDPLFPDDLNSFYGFYQVKNISEAQAPTPALNDKVLQLTAVAQQVSALARLWGHVTFLAMP